MYKFILIFFISFLSFPAFSEGEQAFFSVAGYQLRTDGNVDGNNLDDSRTSPAIFLGYKFSHFLSVDVGYYDMGRFTDTATVAAQEVDLNYDVTAVAMGINAILPLKVIDLYAKLGSAAVRKKSSVDGPSGEIFLDNDNSMETYVGFGGNINLGDHIEVYAEYTRFFADINIDAAGLGVRLLF